jgi:hypothetical protein
MKRGALLLALSALVASGCGSDDGGTRPAANESKPLPQGSEPVDLDPADFTTRIDNPYWPMAPDGKPGRRWVYRAGKEKIVVTVTGKQKTVDGVRALVLRDVATEDGEVIEDTDDWYAQDREGNVWYLGNDAEEYENGRVVSTKGSWESGIDGGAAGVIMPARPRVGLTYREEYFRGEAEDRSRVLRLDARGEVPFGRFDGALETRVTTPLEPDLVEHKYYARGIGPVMATTEGESSREALVSFRR